MSVDLKMQNRYVGDIGDFLKLGMLRTLSPGYRLGVAWWLYPDQDHNKDGRHIGYLDQPIKWRNFDPQLFDALAEIVSSGQRDVRALEAADILPGAIFASDVIPVDGLISRRRQAREQWFASVQRALHGTDLVFVDPDNGLEPDGYSHGSAKSGKSVLLSELRELARPGRCLIVYHHHTRRKGGHHSEIEYWSDRLQSIGFRTVDALRAKPYSPRVFFLLDAPPVVRQRAEQIAMHWNGLITWHPDKHVKGDLTIIAGFVEQLSPMRSTEAPEQSKTGDVPAVSTGIPSPSGQGKRKGTTEIGYINRNDQEVIRPTGNPGTDHGQYIYVLRCRACGHEYGANGTDIFQRRCPAHDRGAPGLEF
jgi:hypothetical protein